MQIIIINSISFVKKFTYCILIPTFIYANLYVSVCMCAQEETEGSMRTYVFEVHVKLINYWQQVDLFALFRLKYDKFCSLCVKVFIWIIGIVMYLIDIVNIRGNNNFMNKQLLKEILRFYFEPSWTRELKIHR